jgi:hypothetical protein
MLRSAQDHQIRDLRNSETTDTDLAVYEQSRYSCLGVSTMIEKSSLMAQRVLTDRDISPNYSASLLI